MSDSTAQPHVGPFDEHDHQKGPRKLLVLSLVAIVAGALVGLVGGYFRWFLTAADDLRFSIVEWAGRFSWWGVLVPIVLAAIAVAIARALVRLAPESSGSGVQRVEAAMKEQTGLERLRVIPIKFVGGVLALGSGMVLGREGPTVQMGAAIGSKLSQWVRLGRSSSYSMEASMAGAGLAVAFNAPAGGAIFVFEELTKSVRLRIVVPTIAGTAVAIAVSRWILGNAPEFVLPSFAIPANSTLIAFGIFGAIVGALGVGYSATVVWFLNANDRIKSVPPVAKAAVIGAIVGAAVWYSPSLTGGGDDFAQTTLTGAPPLLTVVGILIGRWILGALSYSAGTPGGLFSPLLALGAACGYLFGGIVNLVIPDLLAPWQFALVGMAAFFSAVVRAPLTGAVIVAEMAASTSLLLPSLLACAAASVVATLMRSAPIYDTLRHRMLNAQEIADLKAKQARHLSS